MKPIFVLCLTFLLGSCASLSGSGDYVSSEPYQNRESLQRDVVIPEEGNLSAEEIKALLSTKVDLRRPLKVALVKSDSLVSFAGHRVRTLSPLASQGGVNALEGVIKKSKYIKDISFVPEFLMPKERTIRNLRDVAALMQADLLLILFPRTNADTKFILLGADKAKAVATIESIVVDVKTGAIPFTSIATATTNLEKDKQLDISNEDFRIRTLIDAEDKALAELAGDLVSYFQ